METRFNGTVQFANTFFLQPVDAQGAIFNQQVNWTETRFSRTASFAVELLRKKASSKVVYFLKKLILSKRNFSKVRISKTALLRI